MHVDQKTKHPGIDEVPKTHCNQEVKRPLVRDRDALTARVDIAFTDANEIPCRRA
jgi:hypothetical protein